MSKLFQECMNSIELLKEAKAQGNWKPEYSEKIKAIRDSIASTLAKEP